MMTLLLLIHLSLLQAAAVSATIPQKQPPLYFTQKLDHFNSETESANPTCRSGTTLMTPPGLVQRSWDLSSLSLVASGRLRPKKACYMDSSANWPPSWAGWQ